MGTMQSIGTWAWSRLTTENIRTFAALIQAFGFVLAAILTYRYARKLESHKFEMRLKEIAHANTHKRRMEFVERIVGLMGKLLAKLEQVPNFFDYFELNPLPPEDVKGDTPEEKEEFRWKYRHREYFKAKLELFEAAEEGFMYIREENVQSIIKFVEQTQEIINKYENERSEPGSNARFESLGKFKERYLEIREVRRKIVAELGKVIET